LSVVVGNDLNTLVLQGGELLGEVGIVEYTGVFDEASESLLSQFVWNLLGVNTQISILSIVWNLEAVGNLTCVQMAILSSNGSIQNLAL
jgi:hypothetical protein